MIVQYILNFNSRGFPPQLYKIVDIANKLLGVRGGEPIGKYWAKYFVIHSDTLKMAFNQAKDR